MGRLQRFENRLEQVISGAFARAFRSAVEPVEIAASLQRELDNSAQILSRDRRLVPNTFHVELSSVDHDRLSPYEDALREELVGMLRQHAEEQHYFFTGPVAVTFSQADDLVTGRFRVRSQATAQVVAPQPTTATRISRLPQVHVEVNGTRYPLVAPGLVVGRGADADLRINDPGVSRRHAEFRVTGSGRSAPVVTVADLGSTNGTHVNGHRISEAQLHDRSTVRVGNTELVVRFTEGG